MNKVKVLSFVLFFVISLCLISNTKVFASYSDTTNIIIYQYNGYYWIGASNGSIYVDQYTNKLYFQLTRNVSQNESYFRFNSYSEALNYITTDSYFRITNGTSYYISDLSLVVVVKGSINYNGTDPGNFFDSPQEYEDFINPPAPEPSWFEQLFNDFIDYIGAGINNGLDGFLDWLREAWITPVGEGEDELALDLITPTPTPTPMPTPTPIPYQTQLVPDGNGGFNITYIYNNPSGVPTSAPQPPTNQPQPTGSGSIDDDFDYPYYDNPNNKDDPYTLDIPWYLKFSFGGAVTSLDDFQEGMDAIVDNVNDQDENISVVMDSMGLFPSEWLLIIGFIGAIPLVGGLISRLLKG